MRINGIKFYFNKDVNVSTSHACEKLFFSNAMEKFFSSNHIYINDIGKNLRLKENSQILISKNIVLEPYTTFLVGEVFHTMGLFLLLHRDYL